MLLTVSNLFPRPDHPQRGLFNAQLFREFAKQLSELSTLPPLLNLCLVPEWRVWRWRRIRQWTLDTGPQTGDRRPETGDDTETGKRSGAEAQVYGLRSAVSGVSTIYCPVFYLPRYGRDRAADTYYRGLQDLHVTVRGTRAVFATWLYPDGVAAARLARDLAVPCWIMVQGSDVFHLQHPRRRKALMDALGAIQGFVCVCKPLAETLVKAGVERSKIHVVPNGVDRELFRYRTKTEAAGEVAGLRVQGSGREEGGKTAGGEEGTSNVQQPTSNVQRGIRQPSTINHQPFSLNHQPFPLADVVAGRIKLVLFVGNLVPVKGPDVFLKSLTVLKSAVRGLPSVVSIFIGEGPLRRDLERAARRWGLGKTVHFLGSRPHAEVARWMNLADVLCLTSRSEGMPNVVIESLVSGLPVAVTDVGACRELVEDEPAARLCLRGDVQALARSIRDLAFASVDRRALAARHADRYSWARQAETILGLMGMGERDG